MEIWDVYLWLLGLSMRSWLLLIVLILLLSWLLSMRPWRSLPPGPPVLPLVGSLPYMPERDIRKAFYALSKHYGNVMAFHLGTRVVVILSGYEVIKDALIKHGTVFSGRPTNHLLEMYSNGQGLTTNQGKSQQTQRRFVLQVLRDFGLGKSTMDDIIMDETTHLMEELQRNVNTEYDPEVLLKRAASNIINVIAFGQRQDYHDPVYIESMRRVGRLFQILGVSVMLMFPYLRHWPGDFWGFQTYKSDLKALKAQYQNWIDRHKEMLAEGQEPTDLIGRYLVEINKRTKEETKEFTEKQLIHIIGDLFLAATDTSSSTLYWIILYMALYPDIQKKVYNEIVDITGTSRAPCAKDKAQLHYTEAVVAETMRHSNVTPFTLPHAPIEDIMFRGHHIPKGTMVLISTYSVDMDPDIWPNPEKFDPERHIDKDGRFKKREEQILFSMGKRACLGEGLARKEIFFFLTNMIQKYEIRLPEGAPEPSSDIYTKAGGGIYNPDPYNVIFKSRE